MFVIMFLSLSLAAFLPCFIDYSYLSIIFSTVPCGISLFVIYRIDKANETRAYKFNVKEHIKKLKILYYKVLQGEEINITTEKQIQALISKYNKYIDEQEIKNNHRSKQMATLVSAFYTVFKLILQYVKGLEMQLKDWIWIAITFAIVFIIVALSIQLSKHLDRLQYSYRKMVDDLEDILVLFFS